MSSLILILITGVGLGALYFLVASGLSLIYGLMHVLNFAHGAFLTAGAYAAWVATAHLSGLGGWSFPVAVLVGMVVGALIGALVEFFLIRPLYRRHIEQVLVTVGLGLMGVALFTGIWGPDPLPFPRPEWTTGTTTIGGAAIPNDRFLLIGAAGLLLIGLVAAAAVHPDRADHPGRRGEPHHGAGARHRRAPHLHPGVRASAGPRRRWAGCSARCTWARSRRGRAPRC